jgi:hypothetical protein
LERRAQLGSPLRALACPADHPRRYARKVDEGVRLTTVPGEAEAEALCGLLRSEGIDCAHRPTLEDDSAFEGFGGEGGEREIIVHEADVERARELITPTA